MNKLQCVFKSHLPEMTGTGKNGKAWIKQDFIAETVDQFPKMICFTCWGDVNDLVKNLKEGDSINVKFDVASREYNGKWYTDLKAEGIEKTASSSSQPAKQAEPEPQAAEIFPAGEVTNDDLPF